MNSTHFRSKIKAQKSSIFVSNIVHGLYSKLEELHAKPKFRQLFWQLGEDAFCNLLTQSIITQHNAKHRRVFSELKVETIESKGFVDLCVIDDEEGVAYIIETKYFFEQATNAFKKWTDEDSKNFYDTTLRQVNRYVEKPCDLWHGMELRLIAIGFSATEFNGATTDAMKGGWLYQPSLQNEFYGFREYHVGIDKSVGLAVYGKLSNAEVERVPAGLRLIA